MVNVNLLLEITDINGCKICQNSYDNDINSTIMNIILFLIITAVLL